MIPVEREGGNWGPCAVPSERVQSAVCWARHHWGAKAPGAHSFRVLRLAVDDAGLSDKSVLFSTIW